MNPPKISVIVCVYNGEKYLKECINSIINQTYKNIEIIIINDGSTDNSQNIILSFSDKRIIYTNQKNSGVSASRNNAIKKSSGEYICIIDQDDVISNDYVKYFYNLLDKTKSDIATTPQPDKFFKEIHTGKETDNYKIISGREAALNMLYHNYVIAPWNKMISRKIIKDNNIQFNKDLYGGEGFAFSIECFQAAKHVVVGLAKKYHYRVGDPETGASKYNKKTILSSLNSIKYVESKLKFHDDEIKKALLFSEWHTNCDCFNMMVGCGAKKKDEKLYIQLKNFTKKYASISFSAPISKQQKFRGILFKINPIIAGKIINTFRHRKFKKVEE